MLRRKKEKDIVKEYEITISPETEYKSKNVQHP
jgi:hypothetical protein